MPGDKETTADEPPHWVEGAHHDLRTVLGLSEDAPKRFDFYAVRIAEMKQERDEWKATAKCLLRLMGEEKNGNVE
jgi:hypothetical protein